uniref:TAXi_C domain-containing protein n=1 Tax=Angiostrongylus cantonensis TaxID=6313 RepID=A0A0K0CV82_ANGCA
MCTGSSYSIWPAEALYFDVNTYEGHPSIFRESGVGDVLIGEPGQQSFLMNGTQLQLVGATSGRLAEDQEQFEE